MSNTYTQIHIHTVFAVQSRLGLIGTTWQEDLYRYITGIVQNNGHKLLVINGIEDDIHLLFGMRPAQSLSDLMQDIRGCSSKWINEKRYCSGRFSWQEGYGAFAVSKSQLKPVIRYVENQREHHRRIKFRDEYLRLPEETEIDSDERYVFSQVI